MNTQRDLNIALMNELALIFNRMGAGRLKPCGYVVGCAAMFSQRFGKAIVITDHARARMTARGISAALLHDMIETGEMRYKDEARIWIAKHYADRPDNLICAAAALQTTLVVKTVMHHFSWESGS